MGIEKFQENIQPEEVVLEKRESPETEAPFERHVDQGIEEALRVIEERFENVENELDRLPFHNTQHTRDVVRRTEKILAVIQKNAPDTVDEHAIILGKLAAGYHDIVQRWEALGIDEATFSKTIRRRFTGENERVSRDEAFAYMDRVNQKTGREVFTAADKSIVEEALYATIPDFSLEKNTVIQPGLQEETSLPARAVALADLGGAGMDGPERFLKEGDALFREENLDILKAAKRSDMLRDEEKEYFRQRMIRWTKSQSSFAEGRRALLDEELQGMREEAREGVRALFNKFDASIKAAAEQNARREQMTFEELLVDMGY